MKTYFLFDDEGKLHSFKNVTEDFLEHYNLELVLQFSNNRRITQPIYGIIITFYSLLIVLGSVGNIFILFVLMKKPNMRTARNTFIFNLATSDLLLCLITMPMTLLEVVSRYWPFGPHNYVCKILGFLQAISIYVSTLSITAISMDRYQVIIYPTRDGLQKYGALKIILIIWIISGLLAFPMFVNRKLIYYNLKSIYKIVKIEEICYCIEEWPFDHGRAYYSAFSLFWQYLFPMLIILVAYLRIYFNLKKRNKQQHIRSSRYKKTNTLLTLIALIFAISWLPLNVYNLYVDIFHLENSLTEKHMIFYAICHMIAMSSACFNPVLYGFFNDNFKKELKDQLSCLIICNRCKNKQESQEQDALNVIQLKSPRTLTTTSTAMF